MDSFPNWSLMENCFPLSVPAGFLYRDLRAASGLTLIFSLSFAELPDTSASLALPASARLVAGVYPFTRIGHHLYKWHRP